MKNLFKKLIFISILLFLVSDVAFGISEVTFNDIKKPQGAILFIVDGLGSMYYYPETTPYSLDGGELSKAGTQNFTFGTRILDIKTPHPVTGIAHSVIVTGYSKADEEVVGYPDATIYDITRGHGFVNLAVMEKGDFMNMREEQDIIMFAENNSIDEPLISIQAKAPPSGVYELMYDWEMKLPVYLNNRTGAEKYSAYNRWGIDAANAVALSMIKNHPSRKFFLTVNVGAVDSGGHNLGDDDYIRIIEDLDRDFYPLYKTASENNIALFFTADHGMSFTKKDARRGGHASDKYASKEESLRIPFVILSPNAAPAVIREEYGQEDIAPTILSVLDLPNHLQYTDGKAMPVKNYASIFVKTDADYQVSLWDADQKISERRDSEFIFAGLPLNTMYTLKAAGAGMAYEERVSLDSDRQFDFKKPKDGMGSRQTLAIILIAIVNIAGFIIIKKMK